MSRLCYIRTRNANTDGRSVEQGTRNEQAALRERLSALRTEHRDLDDVIARVSEEVPFDQLQVQRLKKRKLGLKDEILKLESRLLPDIIA
jgi:hypothetical protein